MAQAQADLRRRMLPGLCRSGPAGGFRCQSDTGVPAQRVSGGRERSTGLGQTCFEDSNPCDT